MCTGAILKLHKAPEKVQSPSASFDRLDLFLSQTPGKLQLQQTGVLTPQLIHRTRTFCTGRLHPVAGFCTRPCCARLHSAAVKAPPWDCIIRWITGQPCSHDNAVLLVSCRVSIKPRAGVSKGSPPLLLLCHVLHGGAPL